MNVPKIRLKGFDGEWEKSPLSSVATINKGEQLNKSCLSDAGTYYVLNGGQTPSGYTESFNTPGDTISISEGGNSCGYVAYNTGNFWSGGHNYTLRNVQIDNKYLYASLKSKETLIMSKRVGSGLPNIQKSALQCLDVFYPTSNAEQQQIAEYFGQLDSLIEATGKKITSLKQTKQACLQQMFPAEGETTPRVRFKGFEGEWKRVKLAECLDISNETNKDNIYGKEHVLSVSDEVGVVNQIEYLGRSFAGKSVANYGVLKKGQIVYTKSPLKSKPFGIVKQNLGDTGIVSVLYAIYDVKEGADAGFIHYYFDPAWRLNAYIRPLVNKGAKNTMNISDETALEGCINQPTTLAEQQQIAAFFSNMDKQIRIQEQRLEKLKQIKTACLENMFV